MRSTAQDTDGGAAQTDANGAFAYPELLIGQNNQPTSFSLFAQPNGYEPAQAATLRRLVKATHADVTLVLHPITNLFGAIQGHVYDQDTGLAIAGAQVGYLCVGVPGETCGTTTDANGFYRLDHVYVQDNDPTRTTTAVQLVASIDGYYAELGPG